MTSRARILLLLLAVPLVSAADEDTVYESLSGVAVGRVFMSQDQRDELDVRPRTSRREDSAPKAPSSERAKPAAGPESAGYIIGRGGPVKVWKGGNFVDARDESARSLSFPGDVKITRHRAAEETAATAEADDTRNDDEPDDEPG